MAEAQPEPARGAEPPLPGFVDHLPDPARARETWQALGEGAWQPVEAAVDAMSGRSRGEQGAQQQQREALLKVHSRLHELSQERGVAYAAAFEAYMLHAGARLERERGAEAASAALLGAVVFAMDAQQEPGAPAALRAMLAPAASVAAAVLAHVQRQKPPARVALTGLMAALGGLLLDCSKLDLAAFTAELPTAEAALRCAVAAGAAAAARGSPPQRSALWADLLPAAFKAIRKLDDMDELALLEGERWRFVSACGALLGLALSATEGLRLDVSLADALAPLDRQEVAQGAVTLAHQLGCAYRERLAREPPPDAAAQSQLDAVLRWLSQALQLLSLLLQHGGQMEAFLDDGGVMSLCLHLAKYPAIHAGLPPTHAAHAVDCQVVELLTYALNNSKRARELLSEGDQSAGGSGVRILLAALAAAPGLQALLADAVVHSQLARWTFKRSLLKCLEAAVLTTSDHRREVLANDGVGVIVRSCRWRPHDPDFRPKQEAQLVRANPAFVRGIAGNAFSCLCIASQNLDDDKGYWNQVASKLAEATSADELMSFHKWMPAGQDPAQALLNADKLSCSWGLHTALWRLLHPLTYNNKEQRAVFAANDGYVRVAAAALSLPNSDEALTKGRVCAFKPTVMYILYNAAIIDDGCRKAQLALGVHLRALELLRQSFQMAGEQDRRILKAAATSKRAKGTGGGGGAPAGAGGGAKDAKTFQAGVGGQADAASLLLEGLLLKSDAETQALCRELVGAGKLAAVSKALNNRIGSSYSESTLQTAERSFLKVLRHAEQAVSEQRQQQQQAAAAEAERLAAELLAAEEAAAARSAARAAKQQQRQRAAKQQAAAAAAAAASSSSASSSDDEGPAPAAPPPPPPDVVPELLPAAARGGGGGAPAANGGGALLAPPPPPPPPPPGGAPGKPGRPGRAGKEAEQHQGYQRLLQQWEEAEAAAAAEAASAAAAKKRSKKQQQRERAKEKKQAKAAAAAGSAASTPAASPKAAVRPLAAPPAAPPPPGAAKVLTVPLNGARPASGGGKPASPAAPRVAPPARPPGAPPARPASAGATAAPPRAPLARPPGGPPMSFAAAAAAGTGQTVGRPPGSVPAEAPPPTPPRPPPASPLLSPQRPAAGLEAAAAPQAPPHTPPRVLRAASAPLLPAVSGAAASAPASAAPSPQRSLFADMLPPMGAAAAAAAAAHAAAAAAAASAPQSGAASGVASPTHPAGHLPPAAQPLGGGGYAGFGGGFGPGLLQHGGGGGGAPPFLHQQHGGQHAPHAHHGTHQLLGPLNPSALEAALAKPRTPGGGAEEDGLSLGLLPFAVAEAALLDDSPAAAHALPLSVAGFVLGDGELGGGGGGMGGGGGLRDSQGSDFSDMLGQLLPGGSPLKQGGHKGGADGLPPLNGAAHPRRASSGGEGGLPPGGGSGGLFGPPPPLSSQQQLSFAAAAAWAPQSSHSSLDSDGTAYERGTAESAASSWLKGRQLA